MAKHFPTVASCDFGTSKVSVLVCEMAPEGLEVIGFGQSESHGVRKGVIVNIDSTVMALTEAIAESKNLSGRDINYLVAGVTGAHIQAMPSHGMVPIRDQEVKKVDIEKAIEAASAVNIPLDREIIQMVPQEYIIDGQDGIRDPIGMYGKRLEVNVQLITGSITPLENIRRCLSKVGQKAHQFISSPLASARAVSTLEEKESGVCVVDIGAASTDLAVFQEGSLKWIRSIPIGGMHLTNDLAVGLKTTIAEAQKLKHQYGAVSVDVERGSNSFEEKIEIPGLSGCESRLIERRMLANILQPRIDEILSLTRNELAKQGIDEVLPSGIILTGGTANLKGIIASAERVFRLPVRIGKPTGLGGLSDMVSAPAYSTAVGLLQLGFEENEELRYFAGLYEKKGIKRVHSQFSRWFKDFF
ncbi:MAG: cell division protein FtsA [Bacteriovoracaceae bacterium]|nr:cell division protein FtsA [Bacteriovoracaceae bacterium]